jgi:hypothetical protein
MLQEVEQQVPGGLSGPELTEGILPGRRPSDPGALSLPLDPLITPEPFNYFGGLVL